MNPSQSARPLPYESPSYESSPYESPSYESPSYGNSPHGNAPYEKHIAEPVSQEPPQPQAKSALRAAFRRFWPLTGGDRGWMVVVCCCTLLTALGETVAILLFGSLTDGALRKGKLDDFWAPAGQWLAVAVVAALAGYLGNCLTAWIAERFVLRLRAKVFSHLQTLPPHFFQQHREGDLVERLTGDVDAIEQLAVTGILQGVSAALSALLYAAAALWLRWDLALATFLMAPLFWLAARRLSSRLSSVSRQERVADGAITSVVTEALDNLVLTQAYNRQPSEEKRLDAAARSWLRAAVSSARLNESYQQSVEVIETVCVLVIIGLGAWEISAARMTLGQLLAFAAFIGYLYPPIRSLGGLGLTAAAATAGAERLLEILDTPPSVADPAATPAPAPAPAPMRAYGRSALPGPYADPAAGPYTSVYAGPYVVDPAANPYTHPYANPYATPYAAPAAKSVRPYADAPLDPYTSPYAGGAGLPARGHLELRNVTFTYPGAARPVLRDVSFTAEPGEVVVITGPSGTGKSTLAALLLRFYDPEQGTVRLDGVPLPGLPLRRLRANVTLLPQRTHILRGSVWENIASGRPGSTAQEIQRAAEAAGAHRFITELPDGYHTPLAPHTTRLSGGQLQRVAVARAMLRDTPVMVLDEPTTGLDPHAVRQLLPALRRLSTGRTTLIVSHDLEVAAIADRVLLLTAGTLTDSAAPTQLLTPTGALASPRP